MAGVAQGLKLIAVKTVAAIGEQVDERHHKSDSQQCGDVSPKTGAHPACIPLHIHHQAAPLSRV
jgi:hypothetical protein